MVVITNPALRPVIKSADRLEVVLVMHDDHAFMRDVAERQKDRIGEELTRAFGMRVVVVGARTEACPCGCHVGA